MFAIAFGSVILRMPFTLQYAREDVPEEYWHEPEFLRVNYLITWVWVVGVRDRGRVRARTATRCCTTPNNIWTGWIIQTLPLIIAAQFTIWYPNRLDAIREGAEVGADGPATSSAR